MGPNPQMCRQTATVQKLRHLAAGPLLAAGLGLGLGTDQGLRLAHDPDSC